MNLDDDNDFPVYDANEGFIGNWLCTQVHPEAEEGGSAMITFEEDDDKIVALGKWNEWGKMTHTEVAPRIIESTDGDNFDGHVHHWILSEDGEEMSYTFFYKPDATYMGTCVRHEAEEDLL